MINLDSSNHIFDKKPIYDDDWIYDDEPCPICKQPMSEHGLDKAVDCALKITKGATS